MTEIEVDIDELFRAVQENRITLCETCDTFFPYVVHRRFCDGCRKARRKAIHQEYKKKPEVIARRRLPENVAKKKAYDKEYRNRDDIKERHKKYRQRPDVKKRGAENSRRHYWRKKNEQGYEN